MTLSPRAVVTTARTYNRPLEGGAIETWNQTIHRVIMHQRWLWERAQGSPLKRTQQDELLALQGYMIDRKVLPAGRTLWLGGTELAQRRQLTNFNCSYLKLQTINDVVDHMWLLLNGCGVGFSMEKGILNGFSQYIPEVEVIRSERAEKGGAEQNSETWDADKKVWTIQVGDSGEAWAKTLGKLLSGKYPAKKLVFDLSQIRPAGGRLSQYGWISAGDEVIAQVLPRIAAMLNRRAGQLLSKIDILDLGNYMGQIQTGRRGAEIALMEHGDKEWEDFARAKDKYWETGNTQREQSNNSLVFYRKPSRGELNELMSIMTESGGSEPGIVNGGAALNRAPYYKGSNPCLVGSTLIPTTDGLQRISDLEDRVATVRDGKGALIDAKFAKTGTDQRIYEVELSDGSIYEVTGTHNFVDAEDQKVVTTDLQIGQELKAVDNKGMFGKYYEPKHALDAANREEHVPHFVLQGAKETVWKFLSGLFPIFSKMDGWAGQVETDNRNFLQDVQALMRQLGLRGKISEGLSKKYRLLPVYEDKKVYVHRVEETDKFEDVYCCSVPTTHSFNLPTVHSGNCNEILLGNYSFCNLVETDIAAFKDDPNSMHKAHWLVARANYRQTCVDLDDGVLQRAWHENNEFLRLCGAGLTGIVRRPDLGPYDFKRLRNTAITGAYSMAEELKMPLPKNVTTVKPSGTVGKIMDTTEGIHRPLGKYIFNNITFSKHHPLVPELERAGYNVFSHPTQSDAVLVTFPVKYEDVEFDLDENGKAVNHESALDQLNRYKMLMDNYVDHNCSITVSYGEDEVEDIVQWLDGNWDSYVGVSFLPRTDPSKTAQDLGYPYLPQEVRFQEDWERYALNLGEVDPYKVVNDDSVEDTLDADCQGGACPVR